MLCSSLSDKAAKNRGGMRKRKESWEEKSDISSEAPKGPGEVQR